MTYKHVLTFTLLAGCLTSGYALADDNTTTPVDLEQCKALAQLTPMDIFSKTQNGVSQEYDQTAVNCFKSNACASLPDVDQASCARSLALNSYLIDVAYKTHGPAYPPYSNTQPSLKAAAASSTPTEEKATATTLSTSNVYSNLVTPSVTADDTQDNTQNNSAQTKEKTKETETINWS